MGPRARVGRELRGVDRGALLSQKAQAVFAFAAGLGLTDVANPGVVGFAFLGCVERQGITADVFVERVVADGDVDQEMPASAQAGEEGAEAVDGGGKATEVGAVRDDDDGGADVDARRFQGFAKEARAPAVFAEFGGEGSAAGEGLAREGEPGDGGVLGERGRGRGWGLRG